jgi:uncharacterized protein
MTVWLSMHQAQTILDAADSGKVDVVVSLDLGMTESSVSIKGDIIGFPDGQILKKDIVDKMRKDLVCCMVEGSEAFKLQFFRKETNRLYRLVSTGPDSPPTAELGGFRMHRTKATDPAKDTRSKIDAIKPVRGRVLDICTGLGYTAIAALLSGAGEVYTFEVDGGMEILRGVNPWSKGLADERIVKIKSDVSSGLDKVEGGFFDRAIHDPPSMNIAGELYSQELYGKLHRVMCEGGILYHYVGAPRTKYRGVNPVAGVMKRLRNAGFKDVKKLPEALGVTAQA